jgi:two-component system chemotaxis sensor kinase CheA
MNIDSSSYRNTFFTEAREHLAALEASLLRLETDPADLRVIDEAFRAAHSIKGGADAVGFPRLAEFTHKLEGLLDRFRSAASIPRPVLDLLLAATDMLTQALEAAQTGQPEPPDIADLANRLQQECASPSSSRAWLAEPAELLARLRNTDLSQVKTEVSGTCDAPVTYTVTVRPHAEALRSGIDPLVLLQELAELGTVETVQLHTELLPPLCDLDPERCYVSWTLRLKSDRPRDAIADVFAFAPEMIAVSIETEGAAPASSAMAHNPALSSLDEQIRHKAIPDPLRLATFLVERKVLTAEQALAALNNHRDQRPHLGSLAVELGMMSVDQLFEVINRMGAGDRFGQTAVDLGYLTGANLGRLLLLQEQRTPPLHECLVANGTVDPSQLEAELAAFRTHAATVSDGGSEYTQVPPEIQVPLPPGESIFQENGAMIPDFCAEATEHLETIDRHLLILDADPGNAESLNAIYRGFHTIKGVSSMLRLEVIRTLAHEAENLLNLARDGKVLLRGKPLDLVFASTDFLKRQIHALRNWKPRSGRLEADATLPQLLAELKTVVDGKPVATPAASTPLSGLAAPATPTAPAPSASVAGAGIGPESAAPPGVQPSARSEPADSLAPMTRRAATADKETVRVDKERLDKLINTIGELVIAQSMAQQEFDELTAGSGWNSRALPELSNISRDLQELSLSLRMVPLQSIFQKMTRLVRDLSRKMGKPVELQLYGEETELDKTVVDQLGDPLMHMVRNAIDHGLESPEERQAVGKPVEGHVVLRAYHQGGNVYIELSDDGRGLDRDRILQKAIEKGLVADNQRLSDAEIYSLIFAPGFSTAKTVTDVSGRGVGMDVVRRNVEALQGNILIRTQMGKGTTFTIRLPLTLAIMDGLMVGLGDDIYILPLLSVVESFRPRAADIHLLAGQGEVVRVRDEVVPLLRLYRLLDRPARITDPCAGLVVLVEDQGNKYAILVDELLGQMQAVVKSLDANFRRVEGLAGATILGDGRVAMILDVHGLTQLNSQFNGTGGHTSLALAETA